MQALLSRIFQFGPLIFAFGFIAPLTADILQRAGHGQLLGLSALQIGLLLALVWGGVSQLRGRWI